MIKVGYDFGFKTTLNKGFGFGFQIHFFEELKIENFNNFPKMLLKSNYIVVAIKILHLFYLCYKIK